MNYWTRRLITAAKAADPSTQALLVDEVSEARAARTSTIINGGVEAQIPALVDCGMDLDHIAGLLNIKNWR